MDFLHITSVILSVLLAGSVFLLGYMLVKFAINIHQHIKGEDV